MKRSRLQSKSIAATAFAIISLFLSQCCAFPIKVQKNEFPSCQNSANRLAHSSVSMTSAFRSGIRPSSQRTSWRNKRSEKMYQAKSRIFTGLKGTLADESLFEKVDDDDYLVLDSLQIPDEDRPSLINVLQNPRDALALSLLVPFGLSVSFCNIFGIYNDLYDTLVEVSAWIGILSGMAAFLQIATSYKITNHSRRLLVNDAAVNGYAGLYALAVSWLALRTGNHCPECHNQRLKRYL